MPSPLSTAVLRALSFLHPKKDPSLFLHRSLRRPTDAALSRISSPNPPMSFATYRRRSERNEAAISASENRPARIHSDRASFEGKREGREREMDALHDREEKEVCDSRLLTLPTVLTLGRVVSVPLLVSSYHMNGSWATTTTTGIFLVAAVTDWLDGYLARKMQLGSTFGAFLDPVADKLMVAATLILLCTKPLEVAFFGVVPWILTVPAIAIIGREITMSAVREWAASQNSRVLEAVAVNNLGKWKTATQMTALTILLLTRDPSLTGPGFLVSTGVFLLYVSAGLALWSLAVYMRKIWRFMIK